MKAKSAPAAVLAAAPERILSPFFRRLVQTDFPMSRFDRMGKLPVFYYDNTALSLIMTGATRAIKALLPHPDMHPLELYPGRALVAFNAFEYRDSDIDPYGEFSISFPISFARRSWPGLGVLRRWRQDCFESYVWQLPVTTEIARWGGVELYGYPKFVADIEFTRTPQKILCELGVDGTRILSLEGDCLQGLKAAAPLRYKTYSMKNGLPLCANIDLNPLQFAQTTRRNAARLQLHPGHAIADTLLALDLSSHPLIYQYCPHSELVLFAPRNLNDD